jgi:hypothetical protein
MPLLLYNIIDRVVIQKEVLHLNKKLPPSAPFIVCGIVWAAYAVIFPYYRLLHIIPAAVLGIAAGILTSRFTEKPEPKPEPEPVINRIQEQAAELDAYARRLKNIAEGINDKAVSDCALSVCDTMTKIAENIEANPIDSKKSRTFTKHYVPTVISVFERFSTLEKQNVSDGNIGQSMDEIRASLGKIDGMFRKQLDDMFEDDALDIKTDINVLNNLMGER